MEDIEPDYRNYKRRIRGDQETLRRSRDYFDALITKEKIKAGRALSRGFDFETYQRGRSENKGHESLVASTKTALRVQTLILAHASRISIMKQLDRVQKKYFRRLARYRHLPIITYDAETPSALRHERGQLLSSLLIKWDKGDPGLAKVPDMEWIAGLLKFRAALDAHKRISKKLSEKIVTWEKSVDDKWRLNLALAGIGLTVLLFLWSQIKEFVIHREAEPSKSSITIHLE